MQCLVPTSVGKREEKFSLKTRDPTEAKVLVAKAVAEIDERWSNPRHGRIPLIHKQAWAVAGEIYREFVAAHEDQPREGTSKPPTSGEPSKKA